MSDRLTVLSSMATRSVLAELARDFELAAGAPVALEATGGVDAAKRVRAGGSVDVVVLAAPVMEQLEREGHLVDGSRADVARSGMAIAVPAAGPRVDVGDAAAVRRAMLSARRVSYSTGPSGDHVRALWRFWGIDDAMAAKSLQAPPGVPVAELLARGDADLGFQQLSEFVGAPGIAVLGPLPAEIQAVTTFSAAVSRASTRPGAARAFVGHLASPAAAAAKRRQGLEPA
ncbi:ABC transporter substrate-binding protein [Lichenibacterium minor]|uniref:ABC transporter substrate-binding protein n=1 Tax=Lichenibacterium minor TaxID=2316528 RepID=A0A4Q2U793_9HYPH|nr:substrate-binding domain-containing protein [Lichenibacterium minor]RYC30776.1 ABC transporter substrate-binding protein [Lichenibacterium minor]